ncbi:MAG: Hsp70 family protein [Vallitaleaceae bacterium]|nr:Hsp70 family protein [Vallitaleaceae bacterium]
MGTLKLEFEKGLFLGIDFGTTNTVVSVYDYDAGSVYTIPIDGQLIFPTAVQFEMDMEVPGKLNSIFGIQAKESAIIYPESTILSVKRLLGKDQPIQVVIEDTTYDFKPEDIVAQILSFIKIKANDYIHEEKHVSGEFSGCVITVPANSTDKQKNKMRYAAMIAGFMEDSIFLRLEPAAAAISYAQIATRNCHVLVYDFGGGTFDACLLNLKAIQDEEPEISITSTHGDNHLGGDDLDRLMMDMVYDAFLETTGHSIDLFDLSKDDGVSNQQKKMALVRMKQVANHAKEQLSKTTSTKIVLAPLLQEPKMINISLEISREAYYNHKRKYMLDESLEDFKQMEGFSVKDLVARTMACVDGCLEAAGLMPREVDEVFLVGGSSAIVEVIDQIRNKFEKEPYKAMISPALSISQGAAYYCNMIMLPSIKGPKVFEKTVHPLGLEIAGRRFMEIIEANMPIPEEGLEIEGNELLYTNHDDITGMAIVVYEDTSVDSGKRLKFVTEKGMKRLGATTLKGIPKAPKGEEKVKVVFKVNRNHLLTVVATSTSTTGVETILAVDQLY